MQAVQKSMESPRAWKGAHRHMCSLWLILAVVFLGNMAVAGVFALTLGRLSFLAGAPVEAAVVEATGAALLSSFFLWLSVIQPAKRAIAREARKFSSVIEAAPEGILEMGADGRIRSVNAEASRLFGYAREELIGQEIEILIPQRFREGHVPTRERYAAAPRTRPMGSGLELVGRHKSGEELAVEVSLSTIHEMGARIVICMIRDVRLQKAAKNEAVRINERLRQSLEAHKTLSETLTHLNGFGELLQSCETLPEAYPIVTALCQQLFPGQSGALFLMTASKTVLERVAGWGPFSPSKPVVAAQECWALRRGKMHTNTVMPCQGCGAASAGHPGAAVVCVPMIAQGDILGVLHLSHSPAGAEALPASPEPSGETGPSVISAAVERIGVALANLRLREALRDQAIRDGMTGLFNRRFLEEYLEMELLRAARSHRPLTVMVLDVDHFKRFNDTFGHKAGDHVLQEIARVLLTETRGSDIACRYGGEELVVVCTETPLVHGLERAEQIRASIENLAVSDGGQPLGKVTVSIGLATAPEHGYRLAELVRAADEALYAAKKAGRNQVISAGGATAPSEIVATWDVGRMLAGVGSSVEPMPVDAPG